MTTTSDAAPARADSACAPRTMVVIPTYNERENLAALVGNLLETPALRLLIVDDDSPDGTGDIADALSRTHPTRVEVLRRRGTRGLGRSYVDGFSRALESDAEVICQMDADFSHDPRFLPDLLAALSRADLVIGSRYLQGVSVVNWPLHRLALSVLANAYVRIVTGLAVKDCTSGFRCWRRDALAAMPLSRITSNGYAFQIEMLGEAASRGWRVREVPIIFVERRQGRSKLSGGILSEALLVPWRSAWRARRRPLDEQTGLQRVDTGPTSPPSEKKSPRCGS